MTVASEVFLKDPPERQLGALAANLARISSSVRRPARTAVIEPMLAECIQFIEWMAPQLSPEIAAELIDLQVILGLWRKSWPAAYSNPTQRTLLSFQAKKWSDQIVEYSGLLSAH